MNTKFRGLVLKGTKATYTLREPLSKGGFSTIFTTDDPNLICKAQVLSIPQIELAYHAEKKFLSALRHPGIVRLADAMELNSRDIQAGFLFLEFCSAGTALSITEKYQAQSSFVPEKTVLTLMASLMSVLQHMHSQGITHRDVKLENILVKSDGNYKLCDFGSCSEHVITVFNKESRAEIEENVNKSTTPLYRSPEQLDLYSGYEIGPKVDVFAAGCLAFMLCFQKPPFESRLSAINKQYFVPETHPYSAELITAIELCFTTNPHERPPAAHFKQLFEGLARRRRMHIDLNIQKELEQTEGECARITSNSIRKDNQVAETTFFEKIKLIYTQMTTQTEGWLLGFVEDNEEAPLLKYNRSVISKCWEKRYKVQKVFEILWKCAQEYKPRCLVTLKLLVLMHNFLRKGPVEALSYDKEFSPVRLFVRIYRHWKMVERPSSSEDIKRNPFVCLLIRQYCLVLIWKSKLCFEYGDLIQGNYSLVPFLTQSASTPLRIPFIESMLDFLELAIRFHEFVQRISYIIDIQRSIILSIVDEEYCAVSCLVFVLAAFKAAIPHFTNGIDIGKLREKMVIVDSRFQKIFLKLSQLFEKASKYASLFEQNSFLLNKEVLTYLKDITSYERNPTQFNISEHISYKKSILGLKIPLTYEQVIKNPNFLKGLDKKDNNNECIQLDQYKMTQGQSRIVDNNANSNVKGPNQSSPFGRKGQHESVVDLNQIRNENIMDFTHQNLIGDQGLIGGMQESKVIPAEKNQKKSLQSVYQSNPIYNSNKPSADQFKDFLTIVDTPAPQQQSQQQFQTAAHIFQNDFNVAAIGSNLIQSQLRSPLQMQQVAPTTNADHNLDVSEIHQSLNSIPGEYNKPISLINFFEDQQETSKPTQNIPSSVINVFGQEALAKRPSDATGKSSGHNFHETNMSPMNSSIDLKEFIIDQVKKNAEQYLIEFKTLKFMEKIGFGHSSEVFRGEWRGREVAIKCIKEEMDKSNEKEFKRQIMTSVKIRHHPNLVTLIGVAADNKKYYIINEYCRGATLFQLLHQSKEFLSWPIRISIARQIALGMIFLHTNEPPIIHRDLKSLNVLVSNRYDSRSSDDIHIKVADFGLSRDAASSHMTGTLGTYHWMAPQIFDNQPYSLKADVFSFGIVLWEIAARMPPYTNMNSPQSLMKFVMMENGRPDLKAITPDCPQVLIQLMTACWDANPVQRPSFSEVLVMLSCIK